MSAQEPPTGGGGGFDILWGDRLPARRGPKPTMSVERIVAAGIEVADADGVSALSMSRVAKHLGSPLMSLYRYVAGRDDLVAAMLDTVIGEPPDLDGAGSGWRAKLGHWGEANERVFHRHPWALPLVTVRRVVGPNELAWLEAALAALSGLGLDDAEKLEIVLVVNAQARGNAQAAVDPAEPATPTPTEPGRDWSSHYARIFAQQAVRDRYPTVARLLDTGALGRVHPGFGLQRVLDGVAAYLDARSGPDSTGAEAE